MTPGEEAWRWIQRYCRIPEGLGIGTPLEVAPFMRADFNAIYNNAAGTRRAIISRGRKNAKTTESAMIVLLHLCGPRAIRNSQIYSAAQSRNQAGILFDLAAKMVRMSPVLRRTITIKETTKVLECKELGTHYRALSAESKTAFGLSPVLTIHDELGQVVGPRSELYEALETATAAQSSPLSIIISTQAKSDNDLLSILIDDAQGGHDPKTVLRLHTAPDDLDPFSDAAIRAANPAFDFFMNKDEVRAMAHDAQRMTGRENDFRNLVLNQRVEALAPFLSIDAWKACNGPTRPLDQCDEVFGGLDLSATKDLTALVLIGKLDNVWHIEPHFWMPSDELFERARLDRVPYDLWQRQGHLVATPGKSVDYEFVVDRLMEIFDRYQIKRIAFDRWNYNQFKSYLMRAGMNEDEIAQKFHPFRQNFHEMSPALKELDRHISNKRMVHGGHPVLTMCALNSTVISDNHENIKLVKKKFYGRIDGMVALAMAVGVIPVPSTPAPTYEIHFVG